MNKIKLYKINFKNHLKGLKFSIAILIGWLLYMLFEINKEGISNDILVFSSIVLLVTFIPVTVVHLEYYLKNCRAILKIDNEVKYFCYIKGNIELKFDFKEIEKIELHMAKAYYLKEVRFFPTDFYHYTKILLKNQEIIYLTSLLAPNINLDLSEITEVKQRFMAFIWSENLLVFKGKSKEGEVVIPTMFKNRVSKKATNELIMILNSSENYDKRFILAAQQELDQRNKKDLSNDVV